jgi:hypothetical protein
MQVGKSRDKLIEFKREFKGICRYLSTTKKGPIICTSLLQELGGAG